MPCRSYVNGRFNVPSHTDSTLNQERGRYGLERKVIVVLSAYVHATTTTRMALGESSCDDVYIHSPARPASYNPLIVNEEITDSEFDFFQKPAQLFCVLVLTLCARFVPECAFAMSPRAFGRTAAATFMWGNRLIYLSLRTTNRNNDHSVKRRCLFLQE